MAYSNHHGHERPDECRQIDESSDHRYEDEYVQKPRGLREPRASSELSPVRLGLRSLQYCRSDDPGEQRPHGPGDHSPDSTGYQLHPAVDIAAQDAANTAEDGNDDREDKDGSYALYKTYPSSAQVLRNAIQAASPDDQVWSSPAVSASVELRSVLDRIEKGSLLPEEDEPQMVSVPADLSVEGPGWKVPDYLLPATLKPAEKRALDLISDWPWITLTDLAGMLGVSAPRASQMVTPLEGFRLVTRPIAGSGRMALTDRALALLARRDRTSVAVAKKRWSAAPLFPGTPFVWDNVTGARSRQLLRNVEHTSAVHAFLAALTVQAGLLDCAVTQVDPPRRASRHFKHGDGMRSVNPDAFGVLRKGETTWPFVLEWERRAVRPSTMSERLAPYLRYFSSHRPTDDHGTRPSVLIVFDDEIVQTHFLRLAREDMQARGPIEQMGPLGRAWRAPDDWQSPQAMPPQ